MLEKKTLRIEAKEIRKKLDMKKASEKLVSLLRTKKYYKTAQNVMIFFPLEDEIDVTPLLKDDKNFYLPRVLGKELKVCPYKEGDELKLSHFKIYEPLTEEVETSKLDLVIVPALMADKNNNRLGYGGRYYDRFLNNNPSVISVALIPQELMVDSLPHDPWDIKITHIISY